jgi:hypothetical protein
MITSLRYTQGWELQGLGSRVKVLMFSLSGGKRFEVQGSASEEIFSKNRFDV